MSKSLFKRRQEHYYQHEIKLDKGASAGTCTRRFRQRQSEEVFEPRAGNTHEKYSPRFGRKFIILFNFLCNKKSRQNFFPAILLILTTPQERCYQVHECQPENLRVSTTVQKREFPAALTARLEPGKRSAACRDSLPPDMERMFSMSTGKYTLISLAPGGH
jgi:hypothetical protein